MITAKRYEQLLAGYTPFNRAVNDYTCFLDTHNLPLSIDAVEVRINYKLTLFKSLLAVDKGLKLRYDLLKSEVARRELIDSTVNLTGYDIETELPRLIVQLHHTLTIGNRGLRSDGYMITPTLTDLFSKYQLRIEDWLKRLVVVWSGVDAETLAVVQHLHDTIADVETRLDMGRRSVLELMEREDEVNELGVWEAIQRNQKEKEKMLAFKHGV